MATAIEYGLIAALIAVAVIGGVTQLGHQAAPLGEPEAAVAKEPAMIYSDYDTPGAPVVMREVDGTIVVSCRFGYHFADRSPTPDLPAGHYCAKDASPPPT